MEIPGFVSIVGDVNTDFMDQSVLYVGLECVSPLEKEHGTTPKDRYLHSAGPFHATDHHYPFGLEYPGHHVRSFEAPLCGYPPGAELYFDQDYVSEIHSATGSTSRSQFSDDTSCDAVSPRSSISSLSDISSPWAYSGNCPSFAVQAAGLSHTVYSGQSIALSSIQGFSDDVPEASVDGHDDYGYDTAGNQTILDSMVGSVDHTTNFDDTTSTQISENKRVPTKLRSEQPSTPLSLIDDDNINDLDYDPSSRISSTKRPRRRSSVAKSMLDTASAKPRGHRRTLSDKGGHAKIHNSVQTIKRRGKSRSSSKADPLRPFPCPLAVYGCKSTFTSKNEWKRHVSTQHVKLGFWRCQLCPLSSDPANPIYNDFNRKDLFTQHVRRMHDSSSLMTRYTISSHDEDDKSQDNSIPESLMTEYQNRCYQHLRSHPPQSGCLFCTQTFEGDGSWDQRMEHLGAHFEREKKNPKDFLDTKRWRDDPELREWLLQEGLITSDPKGGWRIGDGQPRRGDHFFKA
jgi:hypothetical protein